MMSTIYKGNLSLNAEKNIFPREIIKHSAFYAIIFHFHLNATFKLWPYICKKYDSN